MGIYLLFVMFRLGHIGNPDTPFQNYLLTKHPVIFEIIIRVCSQGFSHTPSFLFESNSLFYNLQRKQNASKVFFFPLTLAKSCFCFSPKPGDTISTPKKDTTPSCCDHTRHRWVVQFTTSPAPCQVGAQASFELCEVKRSALRRWGCGWGLLGRWWEFVLKTRE